MFLTESFSQVRGVRPCHSFVSSNFRVSVPSIHSSGDWILDPPKSLRLEIRVSTVASDRRDVGVTGTDIVYLRPWFTTEVWDHKRPISRERPTLLPISKPYPFTFTNIRTLSPYLFLRTVDSTVLFSTCLFFPSRADTESLLSLTRTGRVEDPPGVTPCPP